MSVYRKRMVNGKLSPHFYYEFQVNGKRFRGTTGCTTAKEARAFERDEIARLRRETSVRSLVENFRSHLTGGTDIPLADAWERFIAKPRRHTMSPTRAKATESRWRDFLAYVKATHPDVTTLNGVTRALAEAYITHVRTNGRFGKDISYRRSGRRRGFTYTQKLQKLSPAAQNDFLQTCRLVFATLGEEAGLSENPFARIAKVPSEAEARDAFSPEELKLIGQHTDHLLYPLFLTGITTGLREGDICTLRWTDVDLATGWLERKALKTHRTVRLPLLPNLADYLARLPRENEYVFPKLADLYTHNRTGISYRVAQFLDQAGIKTRRTVEGRDRAVSVKDVHSLRHTFVYLASLNNVPLPIVQSVVGHMSPAMTQHYMEHADDHVKRQHLTALPNYLAPPPSSEAAPAPVAALPALAADAASAASAAPLATAARESLAAALRRMTADNWQQLRDDLLRTCETATATLPVATVNP